MAVNQDIVTQEVLKAVVRRISGSTLGLCLLTPGPWCSCGGQRATCQESESSLSIYCVEAGGEIQLPRLGSNCFELPSQKPINTYFGSPDCPGNHGGGKTMPGRTRSGWSGTTEWQAAQGPIVLASEQSRTEVTLKVKVAHADILGLYTR